MTPTATSAPLPPFGACTEDSGTLIQPELVGVEPAQAEAGEQVRVVGSGGYVQCGSVYNESARAFRLYFDGQPLGSITCYANRCEALVQLPGDASPGPHILSVDGGAHMEIEVSGSD
jgi:hypothetical protein